MELLKYIPTDNLYKFIALSGLAIFIFCCIFPLYMVNKINIELIKVTGELKIATLEEESISQDEKNLDTKVTELEKKNNEFEGKRKVKKSEINEFLDDVSKAKSLLVQLKEKRYLQRLNLLKIQNKNELINYYAVLLKRYIILLWTGLFCGSALMFLGFRLWFTRLQIYQDKIIRLRAEKI